MLDTNGYSWRHNNLVKYIETNVDKKYTVFSDLTGMEAPGGGTIPPALCVTKLKPEIVILENHMKALNIFELTMPLTRNIESRHKDAYFLRDITGYKCAVNCLEVTSTGYIRTRNQKNTESTPKIPKQGSKTSVFLKNLNSLAWYGSYQVWISREDPTFFSPSYNIPHLQ